MAKTLGSSVSPGLIRAVRLNISNCIVEITGSSRHLFRNELVGYGFTHIPSSPGLHTIEVSGSNRD